MELVQTRDRQTRLERRRQQERERRARETPEERDRRRSLRNQRDRKRRRARCAARCASALAQLERVCTFIRIRICIYANSLTLAPQCPAFHYIVLLYTSELNMKTKIGYVINDEVISYRSCTYAHTSTA